MLIYALSSIIKIVINHSSCFYEFNVNKFRSSQNAMWEIIIKTKNSWFDLQSDNNNSATHWDICETFLYFCGVLPIYMGIIMDEVFICLRWIHY